MDDGGGDLALLPRQEGGTNEHSHPPSQTTLLHSGTVTSMQSSSTEVSEEKARPQPQGLQGQYSSNSAQMNQSPRMEDQSKAVNACVAAAPGTVGVDAVPRFFAEESDDSPCSPLLVDEELEATLAWLAKNPATKTGGVISSSSQNGETGGKKNEAPVTAVFSPACETNGQPISRAQLEDKSWNLLDLTPDNRGPVCVDARSPQRYDLGLAHYLNNQLFAIEPENVAVRDETNSTDQQSSTSEWETEETVDFVAVVSPPMSYEKLFELYMKSLSGEEVADFDVRSPSLPGDAEDGDHSEQPRVVELHPDLPSDDSSSAGGVTNQSSKPLSSLESAEATSSTDSSTSSGPPRQDALSQSFIHSTFGINLDAYLRPNLPQGPPPLPPKRALARQVSACSENALLERKSSDVVSTSSLGGSKLTARSEADPVLKCGETIGSKGAGTVGTRQTSPPRAKEATGLKGRVERRVSGCSADSCGLKKESTAKRAPTPSASLESFHQVSLKIHLPCQLDQKLQRAVVQMMPQQQEVEISHIHFPHTFSVRISPSIVESLRRGGNGDDDKTKEDSVKNTAGVTVIRIVVYGHSPQTSAKSTGLGRPWSSSSQEDSSTSAPEEAEEVEGVKNRRALRRSPSPSIIPKRSTSISASRTGTPIGYVNIPLKTLLARGDSMGQGIMWLALTKVDTTKLAPLTPWQLDYYNDAFNRAANTGMEFLRPKVAISFKLLSPEGSPISAPIFEGRSPAKLLRQIEKELEQIYIQADLELQRHKAALKEAKENKKGIKAYIRDFDSPEFAQIEKECQQLKRDLKHAETTAKAAAAEKDEAIRRLQHDLRTARLLIRSSKRRPKAPGQAFSRGVSAHTSGDETQGEGGQKVSELPSTTGLSHGGQTGNPPELRSASSLTWETRRLKKRLAGLEEANQEAKKQLEEAEKQKKLLEAELKVVRDQLNLERNKNKVQRKALADLHALKPQRESSRRVSSTGPESREPKDEGSSSKPPGESLVDDSGGKKPPNLGAATGSTPASRQQEGLNNQRLVQARHAAQSRQQQLLASQRLSMGQPSNGSTLEGACRSLSSLNQPSRGLPTRGSHSRLNGARLLKELSEEDRDILKELSKTVTDNSLPALRSALGVAVTAETKPRREVSAPANTMEAATKAPDDDGDDGENKQRPVQSDHQGQRESVMMEEATGLKKESQDLGVPMEAKLSGSGFTADLIGKSPSSNHILQETFSSSQQQGVGVRRSLARVSDSLCYSESNCSPRSFGSPQSCHSRSRRNLLGNASAAGGVIAFPSPIREESGDESPFPQLADSPSRQGNRRKKGSPITEMLRDAASNKFDARKHFQCLLNAAADAAEAAAAEAAEAVERLRSEPAGGVAVFSLTGGEEDVRSKSFPGGGRFKRHPAVPRLNLPDSLVNGGEKFVPPPYDPFDGSSFGSSTDAASPSEFSCDEGQDRKEDAPQVEEREKDLLEEQAQDGLVPPCEEKETAFILKGNEPCFFSDLRDSKDDVVSSFPKEPVGAISESEPSSLVTENDDAGSYGSYTGSLAESDCEGAVSGTREPCPSDESDSPMTELPASNGLVDPKEDIKVSTCDVMKAPENLAVCPSKVADWWMQVPSPSNERVLAGSSSLRMSPTLLAPPKGDMSRNGLTQISVNPLNASIGPKRVVSPEKRTPEEALNHQTQDVVASLQKGSETIVKTSKPTNFVLNNIRTAGKPKHSKLAKTLQHGDGHLPVGARGVNRPAAATKPKGVAAGRQYSPESGVAHRGRMTNVPKRLVPTNSSSGLARSPTKKGFSPQRSRGVGQMIHRSTADRRARVNSSSPLRRVAAAARAAREASCRHSRSLGHLKLKESKCMKQKSSGPTPGLVFSDGDCVAWRERGGDHHFNFSSDESSAKASEDEKLDGGTSLHESPQQYLHAPARLRDESAAPSSLPGPSSFVEQRQFPPGGHMMIQNNLVDGGVNPTTSFNGPSQFQRRREIALGADFATSPRKADGTFPTGSNMPRVSSRDRSVRASSAGQKWPEDGRGISADTVDLARRLRVEFDEEFSTIEPYIMNAGSGIESQATNKPSTATTATTANTYDQVYQRTVAGAALKRIESRAKAGDPTGSKVTLNYEAKVYDTTSRNPPPSQPPVMIQNLAPRVEGTAPLGQSMDKQVYPTQSPLQTCDVPESFQGMENSLHGRPAGLHGEARQAGTAFLNHHRQVPRHSEVSDVVPNFWAGPMSHENTHQQVPAKDKDHVTQTYKEAVRRAQRPLMVQSPDMASAYPPSDLHYYSNDEIQGPTNFSFSTPYTNAIPRASVPSLKQGSPTTTAWLSPSELTSMKNNAAQLAAPSVKAVASPTGSPGTPTFKEVRQQEREVSFDNKKVSLEQLVHDFEQRRREEVMRTAFATRAGTTSTPAQSTAPSSREASDASTRGRETTAAGVPVRRPQVIVVDGLKHGHPSGPMSSSPSVPASQPAFDSSSSMSRPTSGMKDGVQIGSGGPATNLRPIPGQHVTPATLMSTTPHTGGNPSFQGLIMRRAVLPKGAEVSFHPSDGTRLRLDRGVMNSAPLSASSPLLPAWSTPIH